jgi:hypothetical protein
MAKKQFPKKPEPKPNELPVAENAPPEDSKIKPLDPPPPGAGGGTTDTGDENQAK